MPTVLLGACSIFLLAQPAPADATLSVVLSVKTPALMNALNLIAAGAGFYKDEHLLVSTTFVDGALQATQLCSSGKGDICPIGIEPLIINYGDDIRLKMFLARSSKFAYVIAVPEESPINTLADFRGKTLGVHVISAAASGVFTTQSALAAAGLRPTDYTLAPIGYEDEAANALVSGRVAGAAFPYYEFIPFIVAGRKLRIFHHPTLENVANVGYAAAPSVLANKGNAVKRFSRAIVKASLLVRYNAAAAARFLLTAEGRPIADESLRRKTEELLAWEEDLPAADPNNKRIGAFSLTGLAAYIQLLKDAEVTKTTIPVSQVVTEECIEFANDFDHKSVEKFAKSIH
jgi:NitT/TauT family transport system substrate-binding protein